MFHVLLCTYCCRMNFPQVGVCVCVCVFPTGSSSSQCASGQRFPCPTDVAYYAYPDYDNAQCNTYFRCQHGQLTRQLCAPGTKFDSFASRCKTYNPGFPLFFTFFCDDVRSAFASPLRDQGD